ncbi:MAG: hypothetical protein LBM01_01235 [Christensenellaceae bacterium]|jgi:hypothetical protein|nr:hypothetical protein [Christensenellaceae bacterium]
MKNKNLLGIICVVVMCLFSLGVGIWGIIAASNANARVGAQGERGPAGEDGTALPIMIGEFNEYSNISLGLTENGNVQFCVAGRGFDYEIIVQGGTITSVIGHDGVEIVAQNERYYFLPQDNDTGSYPAAIVNVNITDYENFRIWYYPTFVV